MVWASRWAGVRNAERVYGPDFMLALCARAEAEGWKSFFYGGTVGVAERLSIRLRQQFPGLCVVGEYSPPFRPLTSAEDAAVVEMIDNSRADLVWIGLSTPKQELWMAEHIGRLRARLSSVSVPPSISWRAKCVKHRAGYVGRVLNGSSAQQWSRGVLLAVTSGTTLPSFARSFVRLHECFTMRCYLGQRAPPGRPGSQIGVRDASWVSAGVP